MKKAKVSQATLFQSWGRGQPAQCSSSRNPTLNRMEINPPGPQNSIYNATDPDDIVDLGDEDDDGELLAAAEGIASSSNDLNFQTHTAGGVQANSSTNISCNPEEIEVIPGFDLETGNVWIYPTNYPIRNYQYDIVKEALFKNTLVTLPTGLGKTFIAAVVMYNFYRWYPQGKVIFMAPTKPLVAQQIEACFNIMGIPQSDTAEMTGKLYTLFFNLVNGHEQRFVIVSSCDIYSKMLHLKGPEFIVGFVSHFSLENDFVATCTGTCTLT